jgi:aspartate racemase
VITIGLIGGMSWEASALYYKLINRAVQKRLGGLHSAKIAMISLDFDEPAGYARLAQWDDLAALLSAAARKLEAADAGLILIGANTAHHVADAVQQAVNIPVLHICDCTATAIKPDGLKRVALLGTAYTMEQDFFKDRLRANGLEVIVPEVDDRAVIHRTILDELVLGKIEEASRAACREILHRQVARGAEGVILGCTELPLLLKAEDSPVPLYDTTVIHAQAAVDLAFS